jgi:hypothetical protein
VCVFVKYKYGAIFSMPFYPDLRAHPTSYSGYEVYSPGEKRLGLGIDHPHPLGAEIKERVLSTFISC